jgi:uncharacterized OsmC-like protein
MSNLQARDALQRVRQALLQRPGAARRATTPATAVWRDGLRCDISGPRGENASTDMPRSIGGQASAPNPSWLLRASMASCTATAIAMRAAMLGIELKLLEVSVHSEADARGLVGIDGVSTALSAMRMSIKIAADDVSEEQLRELAGTAESISPVSCTLRERPPIAVEVSVISSR